MNIISISTSKVKKNLILIGGVLLFLLLINFMQNTFWRDRFRSNEYQQTLAGESVPFDKTHQFNIERFDRELAVNQMNEEQIIMIWKRIPQFKPMIDKKLKEAGVPSDIFYLVLAESALKETAISSAWAGGLRQFMPATAKGYGLRVDDTIDERFHPEKATDAAIKYLKKAYEKFWNRTLAMAAYNRGSNGISNDMAYQYQSNYYDLWLNNETHRYIFRILAFKEIFENLNAYFDTSKRKGQYSIPDTIEVQVGKTDDLAARSASKGYTYLEVRTLNPRIRKNALPEGRWTIKVYKR